MRHAISFSDLAGRKVGVFGLGVEGRAARERLEGLGCEVVAVDDDPASTGEPGVLDARGVGRAELASCEAVVKSPGIPRYRDDVVELVQRGIPVLGGLGMWLEEADRSRVVCVTGTKGKSTVSTVIAHLAERLGTSSAVVGNLGAPPFSAHADLAGRLVVAETSSFQATDVAHSPAVVVVTSLGDDHLDWHGSAARYHADKLSLTRQPGARWTVAADTALLREHREQLGGEVVWAHQGDAELAGVLGLHGRHGAMNAAVAVAALRASGVAGSDDPARLLGAAEGYVPLKGRFREVLVAGGVRYIDDSLATNPLPTIAAVEAVGTGRVAILLGGHDRGVDYAALADAITSRDGESLVVTLPDNGPAIGRLVAARGGVEVMDAADVATAVRVATAWVGGSGTVLLSPAAPSFSQFHNWEARSDAFAAAAKAAQAD